MTPKEKNVLLYLVKHSDWITSNELALTLSISKRSIKSYIKNINSEFNDIILTSNNGYKLANTEQGKMLLNKYSGSFPQDKDERNSYILRKLLLTDEKFNIDELADELCISYATFMSELPSIKGKLTQYKLSLKTKNDYIFIDGKNSDKKKMISDFLYEEMRKENSSISSISKYFSSIDIDEIAPDIRTIIQSKQLYLDDLSMINLLLHLAITAERCKQFTNHIELGLDLSDKIPAHVLDISIQIAQIIKDKFNVTFTMGDIHDIAVLISTRLTKENIEDYSNSLSSEVQVILKKVKERLQYAFGYDITSKDFEIRFGMHLSNMMLRLRNGNKIRNLEVESIKQSYPVIYDVAVFVSDIVERETDLALTEDEIAYIALHIGVLIEEQTIMHEKVNVILLYPPYGHGRDEMLDKLRSSFEDSIIVTKVISSLDELASDDKYDLIISSTLIPSHLNINQVGVGKHLGTKDILLVANAIEDVKKRKEHSKISSRLDKLFHEELFFYNPDFDNSHDAIDFLCNALEKYDYVGKDYRESVFKREELSSCGYDKLAIPHPLDISTPTTAIAVSIHPNGFMWNNNRIFIVLMLAVNYSDNVLFKDVFEYTTYMLSSTNGLRALIQSKTYDEFIKALADYNINNK